MRVILGLGVIAIALFSRAAVAQPAPPADESVLGTLPITGTAQEHVTTLAVLPSLSPELEDVIVRGVARRDLELTGLFNVLPDEKAPPGLYGFNDAVDVSAWRKVGAEVIVKVAARRTDSGKIEVFGLAYFLDVGKDPVYEKRLLVEESEVRITAHRVVDALLGAITGRPGGFASHFTYSGKWGKSRRIFTMDSDGNDLRPVTAEDATAIAPAWGPNAEVFYTASVRYSPFRLFHLARGAEPAAVKIPFQTSIYGVSFNKDRTKMALAVAEDATTGIYEGSPDGSGMRKVSTTPLATHPVYSPSGKLAWIGGATNGTQRVYVDGKAVSPMGFTAAAPTFCGTDDGIRLIYAVSVGGNRQDLVMSSESGQGIARLTQNQGSNSYPACSPDGRMLAFFSTRSGGGLYFMSLKRWKTQKLSSQTGESLRWAELPPPPASASASASP